MSVAIPPSSGSGKESCLLSSSQQHCSSLELGSEAASRGKKSIHHHRGTPPFSVCRPTPRSQSKKSYGVYPFPGKTREKGIHHRSGKKGIHHRASDLQKEKKESLHGGGVYFFLPWQEPGRMDAAANLWPGVMGTDSSQPRHWSSQVMMVRTPSLHFPKTHSLDLIISSFIFKTQRRSTDAF